MQFFHNQLNIHLIMVGCCNILLSLTVMMSGS